MDNFVFDNATKIFFGKGQLEQLQSLVQPFDGPILFVYGGGSIKANGIYQQVLQQLKDKEVIEFSGIEPNPHHTTVEKAAKLCKEKQVCGIVAVGGGSVIDASKVIAAGAKYDGETWDLVADPKLIDQALPIITVLTLSGTGSEMNRGAVITNTETKVKKGTGGQNTLPLASIIDPTFMFSLPPIQSAAGAIDAFSHAIENYFKADNQSFMQDALSESVMRAVIQYAPIVQTDPTNYEARANLAWASTLALNGLTGVGKPGPWAIHAIEHELSAYYDLTHGIGLAILMPIWLSYILEEELMPIFVRYGVRVWGLDPNQNDSLIAYQAISKTSEFFKSLNIPMNLTDCGIDATHFNKMATSAVKLGRLQDHLYPLNETDVSLILHQCL